MFSFKNELTIEKKISLSSSFIISKKIIKIKKLDIYNENRNKLKTYIIQCEFYIRFNFKFFVTSQNIVL